MLTPTSDEDSPSPTKFVVDDGNKWQRTDCSKGVHASNDTLQSSFRMVEEFLPRVDNLHSIDHLRVEATGDLNAHARREEHEIEITQVRLLVPWHLVMLDGMCENCRRVSEKDLSICRSAMVHTWVSRAADILVARADSHAESPCLEQRYGLKTP